MKKSKTTSERHQKPMETDFNSVPSDTPTPPAVDKSILTQPFPIVGIGASAGGLAAFEAFFSGMPADTDPGMAFVLVQHLAPDHKSILTDLIRRYRPDEVEPNVDFFKRHIHPEDLPAVLDRLTGHVEGRAPTYESRHRFHTKSGRWLWVLDRGQIVERDNDGRPVRVTGVISDVTEHTHVEEALRASEARYRSYIDVTGQIAWVTDADGGIVEDVPSLRKFSGQTYEEAKGSGWAKALHPEDLERTLQVWNEAVAAKTPYETEYRMRRHDGVYRHFLARGFPVFAEDGNIREWVGTMINITERKRAEEEKAKLEDRYQQSQKMETVGRLAGGVAHDFNNMLAVILGHTEMALEQVDPDQPIHADLTEILEAANRSADLIRQLLAFARKQTIAPRVLDLNKTIAGILKMLQRLIGEDICLNWNPHADLWSVKVDPSQIDQILTNLCVNARDAVSDVGKLTIETENSDFDEDYCTTHAGFLPGEYVRLAISDNGCGMDKETLSHLYEPFFTTKETGKGTGLGLATVYGIVKQNNGFINVYSEPGQGTTFTIYLPRHAGKAGQLRTEGALQSAGRGHETILLAEDEPALLELTAMLLERQGYTVLAAGTPGEAIRLAREHSGEIHLLMTDVIMPEMNGRDLARNLLALYPHMKRLFTSGYTADVIAHHGVLDEGVHFIQKPFSRNDLAAKVREALDQK